MKIGRGKPFFDQKNNNHPYIFISLAISRSRCYIGPSDLTSRSVQNFLFRFSFFSLKSQSSETQPHRETGDRALLMETMGGRCMADRGQRDLLPMSIRMGLIARIPYSNNYPARHLLANKKRDAWRHVIGKQNAHGFNNTCVSDCNVTALVPK